MSQHLFRKAALKRLSSPEQLDLVHRLPRTRDWAILAAIFLLLTAGGVWAWSGNVATTVEGQGVLIRSGGVISVASTGTGQVVGLLVRTGDRVRPGQEIAHIAQPMLSEQVQAAQQALESAQREAQRAYSVRSDAAKLQLHAIEQQKLSIERELQQRKEDEAIAAEQLNQQEQLYKELIVTKNQVNAARQKLAGVRDEIVRLKARLPQLEADRFTSENGPEQVLAEGQRQISELRQRLSSLLAERKRSMAVLAPSSGEVIEIKTYMGATISTGAPVIALQPDRGAIEAIVYLSSHFAKQVMPGMAAQLSPSTVRREQSGYLLATVSSVAQYPSTRAALMRNFENESLVNALSASGPVTEIRATLMLNPASPSGFRWSSGQGPAINLSSGTLCDVRVVVRRERPAELAFPILKTVAGVD